MSATLEDHYIIQKYHDCTARELYDTVLFMLGNSVQRYWRLKTLDAPYPILVKEQRITWDRIRRAHRIAKKFGF